MRTILRAPEAPPPSAGRGREPAMPGKTGAGAPARPAVPGAGAASGSAPPMTVDIRLPVLRLNPQLTHMTAPSCIAPPHDGQRKTVGAAATRAAGAAAGSTCEKSNPSSGLPASDAAPAGAAAGGCAGTLRVAPHLHLALRPASSGFHVNCRPHDGQANFGCDDSAIEV